MILDTRTEKNQAASGPRSFTWTFYVIYSKDWNILLNSDSFFFKAKFITGYYWIGTIEKKGPFSSFCMLVNNPSDSDSSGIPIFWVISVAKQKFNLQGKKVTENKLKSSDLTC